MEPTYDSTARTTETSQAEGRLKVDVGLKAKKKKKLKDLVKTYKK